GHRGGRCGVLCAHLLPQFGQWRLLDAVRVRQASVRRRLHRRRAGTGRVGGAAAQPHDEGDVRAEAAGRGGADPGGGRVVPEWEEGGDFEGLSVGGPPLGRRSCPSCDEPLDRDAVLCVQCGYHLLEGRHLKTQSRRLTIVVGGSPLTPLRGGAAIAAAAFGVLLCIPSLIRPDAPSYFLIGGMCLLLVAAGLGTAARWVVTKSRKGEPLLIREFWLCFVPIPTRTIELRHWEAAFFDHEDAGYGEDQSEYFRLYLGLKDRSRFLLAYSGQSEAVMHELGDALKEVAGLRWERK